MWCALLHKGCNQAQINTKIFCFLFCVKHILRCQIMLSIGYHPTMMVTFPPLCSLAHTIKNISTRLSLWRRMYKIQGNTFSDRTCLLASSFEQLNALSIIKGVGKWEWRQMKACNSWYFLIFHSNFKTVI